MATYTIDANKRITVNPAGERFTPGVAVQFSNTGSTDVTVQVFLNDGAARPSKPWPFEDLLVPARKTISQPLTHAYDWGIFRLNIKDAVPQNQDHEQYSFVVLSDGQFSQDLVVEATAPGHIHFYNAGAASVDLYVYDGTTLVTPFFIMRDGQPLTQLAPGTTIGVEIDNSIPAGDTVYTLSTIKLADEGLPTPIKGSIKVVPKW